MQRSGLRRLSMQQLERLRAAACSMQHAGDLKIAEVGSEVRGGR
jgi:hypothetical protein